MPDAQSNHRLADLLSEYPPTSPTADSPQGLVDAVTRCRDWLLDQQHEEGYWIGELEGDTILESEYILLLAWMNRGQSEPAKRAARYMLTKQEAHGGWAQYPGGPIEISGSVKAYLALKITGESPESPAMTRAREAILRAGGAERVNSFTRYYLALLGILSYRQCPAVPPELMFLPKWAPFNIYEMSAWSRTILVPLSLLWAHQPVTPLPPEHRIDEIFVDSPEALGVSMPPCELLDELKTKRWINWGALFRGVDRVWKGIERLRLLPFRSLAVRRAKQWMLDRFEKSDGLGAIFPPIIWSIVGLRCLGYAEDSPEVVAQLKELDKLTISEGETDRLEPCRSPVWDTAIALLALREAGVSADAPAIKRGVQWLLSKECRQPGDWSLRRPDVEPGGWFFEFNNEFYPDVDDTAMVVMALAECLPGSDASRWSAEMVPLKPGLASTTVLAGSSSNGKLTVSQLAAMQPSLDAIRRGVQWMLAMQCRNGGWGAFDANNDRELLTLVPFADHNAMIDPPTADITARVLEMFGRAGVASQSPMLKAMTFVWDDQQPDGSWYGRWGVNYIYGTWQVIVGMTASGTPAYDARVQRGADWLESVQQSEGGWGESPATYDHPELRGQGNPTASQTAWALMGLMAAGRTHSDSVRRGIDFLIRTQSADGTWDEPEFTGTGFPKVFYLRYHLYPISFPLMALGRYLRETNRD
ncbi:MAG: prenyltransferase/squalene oxidase repeat-containing protein [Planctomycetaceae bacterium]